MKSELRSLLTFSKKERRAVMLLLLLIFMTRIAPFVIDRLFPPVFPEIEAGKMESLTEIRTNKYRKNFSVRPPTFGYRQIQPFPFDPNTLDELGWLSMGVDSSAVKSIRKYLVKGGRFRHAEDLLKMRRLDTSVARQLMPFVRLDDSLFLKKHHPSRYNIPIIEINAADSQRLLSLPGIGPVLAGRIVAFRHKLGGYYSVEQLKEVYGLRDSVFNFIKPHIRVDSTGIRKIRLNKADIKTLAAHPYIRYQAARAIIDYRDAHGPFTAVDQLLRIISVNPDWLQKVRLYLIPE